MTKQEIFDIVYRGSKAHDFRVSTKGGVTSYRGDNGEKCPVGHLIPDHLYEEVFDLYAIYLSTTKDADAVRKRIIKATGIPISLIPFLAKLQRIHNESTGWWPEQYEEKLVEYAINKNLRIPRN